jgi:chemotaxis protein CheX
MLSVEVISDESIDDQLLPPTQVTGVAGCVGFTGKMSGLLYLCLPDDYAQRCAAQVLGGDQLAASEINDVVGELTNMVTGNLKSKMADRGFNCTLSIPNVLRGGEITIDASQASISLFNAFKDTTTGTPVSVLVFARLQE